MVKIECLGCYKTLKIPQYVKPANFVRQVVYQDCISLLYLKLVNGELLKYKKIEGSRPEKREQIIIVPSDKAKEYTESTQRGRN